MPGKLVRGERIRLTFLIVVVIAIVALATSSCAILDNRANIARICEAENTSRAINNRDRLTLLRGARQAEADARDPKNAAVADLLLKSAKNTRVEIAARPYLKPLVGCKLPIDFPPRYLPKETP